MKNAKFFSKRIDSKLQTPGSTKSSFLDKNPDLVYFALAFFVPFLLMSIAFAVKDVAPFGIFKTMYESVLYHIGNLFPSWGIKAIPNTAAPFGDRQILVVDLWHQYYPFLVDLHDKLQSGGSLFWTWSVGMGTNFIALMSYYLLSPLNFLSVIIPDSWLVEYLALATVIKISCAGLFTAISFKIVTKKSGLPLVIAGTLFALCSFNMGYYWCVIWLDSMAMLPLVFAGTICLLRDGKYKLFIVSLALAVLFNYYIGLFICFAVFFTAIGYTVSRFVSFKKSFKDLLRTVICSLTALLMTAPVTIPAYLALQNCYKSPSEFPTKFDINIGADTAEGVFDAVHMIISNLISFIEPTYKEGLPNVACGVFCIVLLAVFFCSRKIKLGEKIFSLFMLLFLMASFIFRHLDFIWHGMHYPNMLPYRFSFLFSFLLIFMAFRAYTLLEKGDFIDVLIGGLVFALVVFGYFLRDAEDFSKAAVIATIVVGAAMIIILLLYSLKITPRKITSLLLCLLVIGEMGAVAIIGVNTVSTTTMTTYPKDAENVSRIIRHINSLDKKTPDIARTEVSNTQTLNDGALNGYKGISVFNSMANVNMTHYVEYFGLAGWPAGNRYSYYQTSPVTNVIMNLKYIIARGDNCYDDAYMKKIDSSGSVDLYENQAYVPMGFMVHPALETIDVVVNSGNPGTVDNPFENQIRWWQLATGIQEPVYTQLTVKDVGHSPSEDLKVSKYEEGRYSADPQSSGTTHVKFNYYLEEDSIVLGYLKVGGNEGDGSILINDSNQSSRNVKTAHIMNIGSYPKGTKVSLYGTIAAGTNYSNIRSYCYTLNQDVFERGLEILRKNTLTATKATDSSLKGTINTDTAGILYTSIPYEKGWHAVVDGKEVDIVAIGDAMCGIYLPVGEHTVKFYYVPHGFVVGSAAFLLALTVFVLMCVFTSKKFRDKEKRNFFLWLFDPKVKKKKKPLLDENGEVIEDETEDGTAEADDNGFAPPYDAENAENLSTANTADTEQIMGEIELNEEFFLEDAPAEDPEE